MSTDVRIVNPESVAQQIGLLGGVIAIPSGTVTRPNDTNPYASGDLIANSVTANQVVPIALVNMVRYAGGAGMIRRIRMKKTGTSITNALFRVHLYKATPAPSNGDNGAWLTDQTLNHIGSFDVAMDKAFTDGASGSGLPTTGNEINFVLATGGTGLGYTDLCALLEARGAYIPIANEVFTVIPEVLQN